MFEIIITSQDCQSTSSIVADILTPLLSALVGGAMTFIGIRWQAKRDELKNEKRKREKTAEEISKTIANLQIITVNNINILSDKPANDALQEINTALASALTAINQYMYRLPNDVQEAAKNFFEKTRANVYRWQARTNTSNLSLPKQEATCHLLPHQDQGSPEGEAYQAYEDLKVALKNYTAGTSE